MKTKWRVAANVALALASCLVGLALVEAALRSFFPKYEHLATAPFVRDPILGYAREPNRRSSIPRPDTGERHSFHHNNFGSRQHRNFSAADLEASVNVGFFGDSFTENVGIAAQFSFTEPLDHLLNVNAGRMRNRDEGRSFNVLNFGVWGYSTQQSLLRYETWAMRGSLDHVFYVYYQNDLWENQAFHLDDAGHLKWAEPEPKPFAPLGRLHLSYLALDTAGHLVTYLAMSEKAEGGGWSLRNRRLPAALVNAARQGAPDPYVIFRRLLRRFKAAAEGDGASFQLVRLPNMPCDVDCRRAQDAGFQPAPGTPDRFSVAKVVAEEGVETVDLQNCFAELDPAHPHTSWWRSPYRFRRDKHWNEAGNRLATVCLHRFLASRLGLPPMSDHEVARVLDRYYGAFEAPVPGAPTDPVAAAIRGKYDALRGSVPVDSPDVTAPWTPSPGNLVIRSRFYVHLHDSWLAYVRKNCQPSDFHARFFLHVVPHDLRDLSAQRLPSGFSNLDFDWASADWLDAPWVWADFDNFQWHRDRHSSQTAPASSSDNSDGPSEAAACTLYRRLPDYAIERIRTGQFVRRDEGVHRHLWEAEYLLPPGPPPLGGRAHAPRGPAPTRSMP